MDWFTSDIHACHTNIIKHCYRPFNSVDEMNNTIISNWNDRVSKSDNVWCLGDLLWTQERDEKKAKEITKDLLSRLNGKIYLIEGDHDYCSVNYYPERFEIITPFYRFKIKDRLEMSMFHWPIARWPLSHYNSFHIYGHNHGLFQNQGKSFDVGVDCNHFAPLSLDVIIEKMKFRPDNENVVKRKSSNFNELEQLSMDFSW